VFERLRKGLFGRPAEEEREEPESVAAPGAASASSSSEFGEPLEATSVEPDPTSIDGDAPSAVEPDQLDGLAETPARRGFSLNPFKISLGRTRQLFGRVSDSLAHDPITDDLWDELEETLITGDVGVETTERLMAILRERAETERMTRGAELRAALKEELELLLGAPEPLVFSDTSAVSVYLFVGVNGVGKTTTIAKVANLLKKQKHRVILAAGDTFRAAAVEQLKTWGERIGVQVIAQDQGSDAAAVVYDAMQAAQARGADVLLVDTAGRLHTKTNLMEELKKIVRVLQRYDPEAPHEVLLTLDATTGQNGLTQAKQFVKDAGVSGVVLTKLDGTARGGIIFAIASELGLPIKFIGTGEKVGDLEPFDAEAFIDALFDED
jgi:fused signal recognition particle receptor